MMLSQPYARGGTSHAMLTEPASGGPLPSLTRKGLLVISKRPISGAGVNGLQYRAGGFSCPRGSAQPSNPRAAGSYRLAPKRKMR
jgi:hypothetical protein